MNASKVLFYDWETAPERIKKYKYTLKNNDVWNTRAPEEIPDYSQDVSNLARNLMFSFKKTFFP